MVVCFFFFSLVTPRRVTGYSAKWGEAWQGGAERGGAALKLMSEQKEDLCIGMRRPFDLFVASLVGKSVCSCTVTRLHSPASLNKPSIRREDHIHLPVVGGGKKILA
jgi:hypothetical protein